MKRGKEKSIVSLELKDFFEVWKEVREVRVTK
jgi:hypothetical protein